MVQELPNPQGLQPSRKKSGGSAFWRDQKEWGAMSVATSEEKKKNRRKNQRIHRENSLIPPGSPKEDGHLRKQRKGKCNVHTGGVTTGPKAHCEGPRTSVRLFRRNFIKGSVKEMNPCPPLREQEFCVSTFFRAVEKEGTKGID